MIKLTVRQNELFITISLKPKWQVEKDVFLEKVFKIIFLALKLNYKLRRIFWPGIKWQFCQSVHMIFKKIFLENKAMGVVNPYV